MIDRYLVGWLWFRGSRDKALELAARVLARDPSDFTSLYCVVRHLRSQDRGEEALSALKAGLAVDPRYVFALREAAEVCVALGRHDEAEGFVREALREDVGGMSWWVDSLFSGLWRLACLLKGRAMPLPELPSATAARDRASWKAWAEKYLEWRRAGRAVLQQ